MRTALRIAVSVVTIAALAVAVVALVQLHSTRADLHKLQTRVGHVAAAGHAPASASLASRVSQLSTQESFDTNDLRDQLKQYGSICPKSDVRDYYQRLLGAQAAGADVTVYMNLLDVICPDAVGDLRYQRTDN